MAQTSSGWSNPVPVSLHEKGANLNFIPLGNKRKLDQSLADEIKEYVKFQTSIETSQMNVIFDRENSGTDQEAVAKNLRSIVVTLEPEVWSCPGCAELRKTVEELKKDCAELRNTVGELKKDKENSQRKATFLVMISELVTKLLMYAYNMSGVELKGVSFNEYCAYLKDDYRTQFREVLRNLGLSFDEYWKLRECKQERNDLFHNDGNSSKLVNEILNASPEGYTKVLQIITNHQDVFSKLD